MKSNYIYLNSKTFEIEKRNDIIPVDELWAKTISILNQKGYYIEMFNRAKISTPFLIGAPIHDLIEEKLLNINGDTKDVIKKIIKQYDYESTLIVFKEVYKFDNLPKGYELLDKYLSYNLSMLETSDDIKFKSLVDLDHEYNKSLKDLEEWVEKLPIRK